jgi:poly-gamma-glutamate capsule biosynthesis protein CapA/YwtB (metallophosphatase superfamily)
MGAANRGRGLPNWFIAASVVLALVVIGAVFLFVFWPSQEAASTNVSVAQSSTTFPQTTTTSEASVEISIAAVGDVMVHDVTLRVARGYASGEGYDFKPMLAQVAPYLSMADYTICNLETVMAGSGYSYTGYPDFNSPPELLDALKMCGIDLCATANNHSLDKGMAGVVGTLDRLDEAGIAHVGTYRTAEEKAKPFIVDIEGIKVAFINYTNMVNQGPSPNDYSINYMGGPEVVAAEATAARAAGADVVIAVLHWGREFMTKTSRLQTCWAEGSDPEWELPAIPEPKNYSGLLSKGVDVILGAHPHVVQRAAGVALDSGEGPKINYVVYSMGNFLSNMSTPPRDTGAIVYVHIKKTGDRVEVTGLSYVGVMVEKSGATTRELGIVPVLPGVEPAAGVAVSASQQKRLDASWEYLTEMLYKPDVNIVPLTATEAAGAK